MYFPVFWRMQGSGKWSPKQSKSTTVLCLQETSSSAQQKDRGYFMALTVKRACTTGALRELGSKCEWAVTRDRQKQREDCTGKEPEWAQACGRGWRSRTRAGRRTARLLEREAEWPQQGEGISLQGRAVWPWVFSHLFILIGAWHSQGWKQWEGGSECSLHFEKILLAVHEERIWGTRTEASSEAPAGWGRVNGSLTCGDGHGDRERGMDVSAVLGGNPPD